MRSRGRLRFGRTRSGPVGRIDRRARGARAARRRQIAVRRQGSAHRGRERAQQDCAAAPRNGRARPGGVGPPDDRAGRDAHQEVARRKRDPRRLARRGSGSGVIAGRAALPIAGWRQRADTSCSVDEHPERRSARRQQRRRAGVHGRAVGRADFRRGAPLRSGSVPRAQSGAQVTQAVDQRRGRGRIRAGSALQRGSARSDRGGDRQSWLPARP